MGVCRGGARPNPQFLTSTHPAEAAPGPAGGGRAIVVGDNVWLGGGVIICPGVGIAENSVVGAGAVDQAPARQGGRRWHPARVSRLL
jgi:acetyltransferase-like isoleucine patch superfamily enzyme